MHYPETHSLTLPAQVNVPSKKIFEWKGLAKEVCVTLGHATPPPPSTCNPLEYCNKLKYTCAYFGSEQLKELLQTN